MTLVHLLPIRPACGNEDLPLWLTPRLTIGATKPPFGYGKIVRDQYELTAVRTTACELCPFFSIQEASMSDNIPYYNIPGAKSRELLARRQEFVARGVSSYTSIFAAKAEGAIIEDVDGNRYIHFAGGIGAMNIGHARPEVTRAIAEQAAKFTHTCFSVMMYEPYVALAERLVKLTPGEFPKKALFFNSGAEAVENAVKIARWATGRPAIIVFDNAFHGRTLMTMTMASKVKPYK